MCTVSVIPLRDQAGHANGFRLITNRDEQRSRAPALPPRWVEPGASGHGAIYPIDTVSGGTWIAASESGLCLCLLNANPGNRPWPASRTPAPSRGSLIPALLNSHPPGAQETMSSLASMHLRRFPPFTMFAAHLNAASRPDPVSLFRGAWNGEELLIDRLKEPPRCLTSSGLGDDLAHPRLALFGDMVAGFSDRLSDRQDAFHHHWWPDRRHISVLMSRADARTVSITTVEVQRDTGGGPPRVRMDYEPINDAKIIELASGTGARDSERPCYDPGR